MCVRIACWGGACAHVVVTHEMCYRIEVRARCLPAAQLQTVSACCGHCNLLRYFYYAACNSPLIHPPNRHRACSITSADTRLESFPQCGILQEVAGQSAAVPGPRDPLTLPGNATAEWARKPIGACIRAAARRRRPLHAPGVLRPAPGHRPPAAWQLPHTPARHPLCRSGVRRPCLCIHHSTPCLDTA